MEENNLIDMSIQEVREKLIAKKENFKLNYAELSAMVNVSRGTLTSFINGNDRISSKTFFKIIEWLNLEIMTFTTIKNGQRTTIFLQEVPHVQHINKYTPQPIEWIK